MPTYPPPPPSSSSPPSSSPPPPTSTPWWQRVKPKSGEVSIEELHDYTVQQRFAPDTSGLPERQSNMGSDIYFVKPGDSWGSIAISIYGDERFRTDLQQSNPSRQVLRPGMTIVLPDRAEDPRAPLDEQEDFWNTDDFANTINGAEEMRQLLPIYRQAKQDWPEYGEIVYLGFDENNDPYPTRDQTGMPLYWDPKAESWSLQDTGIPYTMGMLENDFIKPLTDEERSDLQELQRHGLQLGTYNTAGTQAWVDSSQTAITHRPTWIQQAAGIVEDIPTDSAFLPTLHDLPQPTSLRTGWWETAIDLFRLGEEFFRGIGNVTIREAEEAGSEPAGISSTELMWLQTVTIGKMLSTGLADGWTDVRGLIAGAFGKQLDPYGVDPETLTKYTEDEIDTLTSTGRTDEIKWLDPGDYWSLEVDRAASTFLAIFDHSLRTGNAGIYKQDFASDEDFEDYIGGMFRLYPEETQRAMARSNNATERQEESRRDVLTRKTELETQAHAFLAAGDGTRAIETMIEAKRLELRAAHWYSPYFMWSRLDEPWREEAFLKAVALAELENMGPLEPRVIRYIRDNYEHMGVNLAMGIAFDAFNFLGAGQEFVGTLTDGIGDLVKLSSKEFKATGLWDSRLFRPIKTITDWMFTEAYSSVGTTLRRNGNNLMIQLAQGTEQSLSGPIGTTRGLDQMVEVLVAAAKGDADSLAELPANVTNRWLTTARGLMDIYNPAVDEPWMRRIDPDNWGQLIDDAYNTVYQREYDRAIRNIIRESPDLPAWKQASMAQQQAEAIASKPRLVAAEFGQNFETAFRKSHATKWGPETLDDNPFWQLGIKAGMNTEGEMATARGAFRLFYGFRNSLFEWWLGLRPGWTFINYLDSTVRFLISGGKLMDDMGTLHQVHTNRLLARDLLREEFKTAFSRGLKVIEGDMDYIEPVVDRILRGHKFKYGLISILNDARLQVIAERNVIREGRSATRGLAGDIARWIFDQVGMTKDILSRGAVNTNAIVEFGLRTRLAVNKFDSVFWTMDKFNLEKIVEQLTQIGASPDTIMAVRKAWLAGADNIEKAAEFMNILGGGGRRSERLFSQILPNEWEDILARNGVDRRLRALVFRPIIEDLEDILKVDLDAERQAREVGEYMDEAIEKINAELVDRSNDPALRGLADDLRPGGAGADAVEPPPAARVGTRESTTTIPPEATAVNLGGEGEDLTVTTEQMRVGKNIVYTMSDEYYRLGELQRESTGRLFDAKRTLQQGYEGAGVEGDVSRAVDDSLAQFADQMRLLRDNTKKFFLNVFPGPLRMEPGSLRSAAWEHFDRLGQQVYDAVITYTDEAIEGALRGEIAEIPSLRELLFKAGIDISFENGAMRAVRMTDEAAGTRVSFSGWRGSAWLRKHLIQSFFGPNVTIKNAEEVFSQPFTVDTVRTALTPRTAERTAEELAEVFGDAVGQATDNIITEGDYVWQAFIRQINPTGGSIYSLWGSEVTKTRQGFIDFLEAEIVRLQSLQGGEFKPGEWRLVREGEVFGPSREFKLDLGEEGLRWVKAIEGEYGGGVHPDTIAAVRRLQDEVRALGVSIDALTLPPELVSQIARPLPRWMLSDGLHSWLNIQNDITAQRSALTRTLEEFKQYMMKGIADGTIDFGKLPDDQRALVRSILDEVNWRKGAAHNIAMDGTQVVREADPTRAAEIAEISKIATGQEEFEGAVKYTQTNMLEYANNYRIDSAIKAVSPFWMFQSRGPLFWINAFTQHPEFLAWWSRYQRVQRKTQMDAGATDSNGRPLRRFYGYFRLPNTDLWFNPLFFSSGKYVLPRPSPYAGGIDSDSVGPYEEALQYVYEYGQMFGFRPAPWITFPLYATGALDANRYPAGSIVSQVDVVVPPWVQREIRRALRMSRYPGDPGLFTQDVGWMDFLVEQEMYGRALTELTENPDNLAKIQSEMYAALGYVVTGYDKFGAPIFDPEAKRDREHPRWVEARDAIEETQYWSQVLGFFTGIYPKEYTDAEALLHSTRDNINFLRDSINGLAGAAIFQLDPVPESRHETYQNARWETPEGWISQLYGASRWIETPGGGQAYGQERDEIMAQRLWEGEVTQAYYDSLSLATDQLRECQQTSGGIGSDSAVRRTCYKNYFRTRKLLDDHPAFDLAQRSWIIGHKTEQMIQDNFERMWWSYVDATMPKWYIEDDEAYDNWQARVELWKDELPEIAEELSGAFLIEEVQSRTGFEDSGQPDEIPGHRILIGENVVRGLVTETTREGYEEYRLKNDTAFDAMNEAFKALQWDPYMEAVKQWESLNTYERDLAEQDWLKKAQQLGLPELQRWVMEHYPDRFTPEELADVFHVQGVTTIQERNLPNSERGVVENEVWEMLSAVGPGENFDIFEEAFIAVGGESSTLSTWYDTGGSFEDYAKLQNLHELVKKASENLNYGPPTQEQLVEWAAAKRMNDDFWLGITNEFGDEFRHLLAIYGSLEGDAKRAYRKANPELDEYYDMRDSYGEANQLWAKYYNPDAYHGGTGLAGEGAEGRTATGASYGSRGGGGSRRKSYFSGGGTGEFQQRPARMIGQGYRSTYDSKDLYDPRILGSGEMAGSPYWPAGFGKNTPGGVLTEIVELNTKDEPLSNEAIAYLGAVKAGQWAKFVAELIAKSKAAEGGGGGGATLKE